MQKTRADDWENGTTYALNCEVRAVTEGHHAFVNPGGSIRVKSESIPDKNYEVKFYARNNGQIWFVCDCKSGENRNHLPVPCKHSALAARRLEREKIAQWRGGLWYVHPDLKVPEPRPVAPPNVSALVD